MSARLSPPITDHSLSLLKLDELLQNYLGLLHHYQKTRETLRIRFSAGYFSLAQANFKSQSRTRYGQDYYDDRMQASNTATVNTENKVPKLENPRQSKSNPLPDAEKSDDATMRSSTNILSDPLHWFGILVPPALREAQIEFAHGLENVLSLCNLNLEMEQLEIEIRRVRKRLGNQMGERPSEFDVFEVMTQAHMEINSGFKLRRRHGEFALPPSGFSGGFVTSSAGFGSKPETLVGVVSAALGA